MTRTKKRARYKGKLVTEHLAQVFPFTSLYLNGRLFPFLDEFTGLNTLHTLVHTRIPGPIELTLFRFRIVAIVELQVWIYKKRPS